MRDDFKKFIDKLLCVQDNPYEPLPDARPYHKYRRLEGMVIDYIHDEMKSDKWYHEFQPKIWKIISLTIMLVLYIQSTHKFPPSHEQNKRE